jgi:hypothetical protein
VTIKQKNNLKIVSTFGKAAWIFSCFIIWYMSWWLKLSSSAWACLTYKWKVKSWSTRLRSTSFGYSCSSLLTPWRMCSLVACRSIKNEKLSATLLYIIALLSKFEWRASITGIN